MCICSSRTILPVQRHLSSSNLPVAWTSQFNSTYSPSSPSCSGFLCISTSLNLWKTLQGFVMIKMKRFHTSAVFCITMGSNNFLPLLNNLRAHSLVCYNISLHALCCVVILYIWMLSRGRVAQHHQEYTLIVLLRVYSCLSPTGCWD